MGSWAQAKLSCGQEGSLGQAWGMEPGEGHRYDLGGVWAQPWRGRSPPTSGGSLVVGGEYPVQEDFLLVSTVDREGMPSQSQAWASRGWPKKGRCDRRTQNRGMGSNAWVLGLEHPPARAPCVTLTWKKL